MEKLKKYKGITLISLVVTIIILIIIAGISISMLLGNEGLLNKAKYATESYSNAQQKEELELAKYSNDINSYVSGNRDYTPINYSTDEQDTGLKWIDGKNIYQKVITFTEIVCGANTWTSLATVPNNIEKLIYVDSIGVDSGTLPHNYSFIYQINQGNIRAYNTSNTTWGVDTLIIRYTKATPNTSE